MSTFISLPQYFPGLPEPSLGKMVPLPALPLPGSSPIAFGELIAALSYALDLTSRGSAGHTLRACILGMKIGKQLGLNEESMGDLYYALLLKDLGCSSNAALISQTLGMDETQCKCVAKTFDWSRFEWQQLDFVLHHAFRSRPPVQRLAGLVTFWLSSAEKARFSMEVRCSTGARVAKQLGLSDSTATTIQHLDEHWDGRGQPLGLQKERIPVMSQICNMAQTLESFERLDGKDGAVGIVEARSGHWFDPGIVHAVVALHEMGDLWQIVLEENLMATVMDLEPSSRALLCEGQAIDHICSAFADVIDAKSHFTYLHSRGVCDAAQMIAIEMGLSGEDLVTLRRAALLHDVGKLGTPNTVLDKPGQLTEEEWQTVKRHPVDSYEVLRRIDGFSEVALLARAHHEKLDGSGYPDGLKGDEIPRLARVLTVADMYDALSSDRPYRPRLSGEEVLDILRSASPKTLDPECVDGLVRALQKKSQQVADVA